MFKARTETAKTKSVKPALDAAVLSVATANPEHRFTQSEALQRAMIVFPGLGRLDGLYLNTGIETRYSCVPADWCLSKHGWEQRTALFHQHAINLLEQVAMQAIAKAGLAPRDIDLVVTNTITGLAVPSLDAMLANRIAFRDNVQRLPIFGFGCGGGAAGLSRAAQLAQADPGTNVLFLTVELCSLCARPNDQSLAMFVSAALFGDGAGAVVLRAGEDNSGVARLRYVGEKTWRNTEHVLGWDIRDDGFGMVLAPELPQLLRGELRGAVCEFLDQTDYELNDFTGFLFHAGGKKILESTQLALQANPEQFRHSWAIMKQFGNMSSATVLFILERALSEGNTGPHLMAAFGPGFSAYFAALEL